MAAEQLTLDFSVVKEVSIVETETRRILKRAQAKALGETRYYNGKPCTNGHLAERLTVNGSCVECFSIRRKVAYWRNPDKFRAEALDRRNADVEKARASNREWRAKNPDKAERATRRWQAKNKDRVKATHSAWYQANRRKNIDNCKAWQAANSDRYLVYRREYNREKYHSDVLYFLGKKINTRTLRALRGKRKPSSVIAALGATLEVVRGHIESMFRDGMSWENWGPVWQLDHIQPLCSFDLTDKAEFERACHYTNLRPLLRSENAAKSGMDKRLSLRSKKK